MQSGPGVHVFSPDKQLSPIECFTQSDMHYEKGVLMDFVEMGLFPDLSDDC